MAGALNPGEKPTPVSNLARLVAAIASPNSYGSVLTLILVTYAVSVSAQERWARSVVLLLQVGTVWLALRVSRARHGVRVVAAGALVLGVAVAVANLAWEGDGDTVGALVFSTSALLYLIAPMSILRAIARERRVGLESVLGAVDAYLLIGMLFAYLYQAMAFVGEAAFFSNGADGSLPQALFFSFTTLTTTGYGNLVPADNPGQAFTVMEMLLGQLFLVTAVAKVIAAWRPGTARTVGDSELQPEGS